MTRGIVVLDAAGTLVEVAGSVGSAYAAIARQQGARIDPASVERGFARAMAAAPPLAFGDQSPEEREVASRRWWRAVASAALAEAGDLPDDFDVPAFFDRAWERFSRPGAWRLYPDVRPALRALRAQGRPLAVFSNWDHRLETLLSGLGLRGWFCRVLVSSELPAAKPSRAAFAAAARALPVLEPAAPPIMVGDRLDHDVQPALAAGWRAVWLDRAGRGGAPAGIGAVRDLRELDALLG